MSRQSKIKELESVMRELAEMGEGSRIDEVVTYGKRRRIEFKLENLPLVFRVLILHSIFFFCLMIAAPPPSGLHPMMTPAVWAITISVMYLTGLWLERPHKRKRIHWVGQIDRATKR